MRIKSILSILISAGLVFSSASYAAHTSAKMNAKGVSIHTMHVANKGYRTVHAKVTVYVGMMHGDLCYPGPAEEPLYFTVNPYSDTTLNLDEEGIQRNFGLGYDCGMMVLDTDKQTTKDAFRMYHNGYRYYSTDPYYDEVSVN